MFNYFNFNFSLPFGMNSWFMPNFSFPNFSFPSLFMPMYDMSYNYTNPFYMQQTFMPSLFQPSFTYPNFSNNTDSFIKSTPKINFSKDNIKIDGYNASKGERLAKIALKRSVGFTGWCATYVKEAIELANLGPYIKGDAYKMKDILKNNSNFKEVSPNDVDVKKLPAGCVLVYDKGVAGYDKDAGHTEITTGDERAVSDGITKNLHKKPSAIFIPV